MPRTLADVVEGHIATVFMNPEHFAVAITYTRGATSVPLTAIVGESIFEVSNEFGITRFQSRDYLIEASTLNLGSGVTLPERGDKIIEGSRTNTVTSPEGASHFDYDDESNLILKVHTTLTRLG